MINTGLTHIGASATKSSQAAQTLSISLGSVIGVAGALGGVLGKIDPAISGMIVGFSRLADQTIRSFTAMMSIAGTASEKIKAAMGIISNSLLAFSVVAAGIIAKTGLLAAEVETLEITLETIARNVAREAGIAGEKAVRYVFRLRDAIKKAGITTREATNVISSFLRARLPTDQLEALAQAAKDFGVTVADMSTSEVLGKFNYFIQSGNTALLKRLGITKTAAMMHKEFADSIGVAVAALTDQQKRLARIQGILKEVETVQGVYNKAMETAGKQLSSMKRLFEETFLTIGKRFLPIVTKLIFSVNNLLKRFLDLKPEVHDSIAAFIRWVAIVGAATGAALGLIPAIKGVAGVIKLLTTQMLRLSPKIAVIAIVVSAIIVVLKALKKAWDENFGGLKDTVLELVSIIKSSLQPIVRDIVYWFQTFGKQVNSIVRLVAENIRVLFTVVSALVQKLEILGIFRTLRDAVNGFMRSISALLLMITSLLRGDWENAWKHAERAVVDVLTSIALLFKNIVARAATWGWNLIVEVANGITKAASAVLAKALKWIGSFIGRFLAPGSPPELGPLAHIVEWGRGVMNTYLRAFGLADFSILRDMMAPIGQALQSAVAAGSIAEKAMTSLLASVRTQVASLIAYMRETGELNEEILGNISEKLGEGGQDIVEYIRRLAAHQKALRNLAVVQAEFAAAETAGFVSEELQKRLKDAEKEVETTKEAVDWQKEFLAAQQETVDMQAKQLKALEKMAGAMEKLADAMPSPEQFAWDIPDEDEIGSIFPEGEDVLLDLGAVSQEWLDMREKIQGVIDTIKDFFDLPIDEKLQIIKDFLADTGEKAVKWLEDVTGLDISGFLDTFGTKWDEAFATVKTWAQTTWATDIKPKVDEFVDWLEINLPTALETAKTAIEAAWDWIVEKTKWLYEQLVGKSYVPDTVEETIGWFEKLEEWFKNTGIYRTIESIVNFFKALAIAIPVALASILAATGNLVPIITGVVSSITGLGELIGAGFLVAEEAIAGVIAAAAPVIATVAGIAAAVAAFLYGVWANKDQILGFFDDFKEELGSMWRRLKPSLTKLWKIVEPIFTAIGAAVGAVAGFLASIALAILPALLDAVETILPAIAGVFEGVFNVIYGIVEGVFLFIANIVTAVLNLITGDTELAAESWRAAFDNLGRGVERIFTGLWQIVLRALNGIVTFFASFAANLIDHATSIAASMLRAIGLDELADKIEEFGNDAWEKISTTWEQIKFIIMFWVNEAAIVVAGWRDDVIQWFSDIGDTISGWVESVTTWFENIKTDAGQAWTDFWDGISTTVDQLIVIISTAVSSFYEDMKLWFTNLTTDVTTFITDGIVGWETAVASLKVIWDTFVQVVKNFWSGTLIPLKNDVVKFIVDGITGWETALISLKALWDLFVKVVKDFWEKTLVPLWDDVKLFIDEGLTGWETALASLKKIWGEVMGVLTDAIDTVLTPLRNAWDFISGAIQGVIDLIPKIQFPEINIPGWLEGLSPPPLANWLNEISSAMRNVDLAGAGMEQALSAQLGNLNAQVVGANAQPAATSSSIFERGAFENAFPGITSAEEASGFMEQLNELVSRGQALSWMG